MAAFKLKWRQRVARCPDEYEDREIPVDDLDEARRCAITLKGDETVKDLLLMSRLDPRHQWIAAEI